MIMIMIMIMIIKVYLFNKNDYDYDENAERKNDSVQEVRQTESGLTEGLWC